MLMLAALLMQEKPQDSPLAVPAMPMTSGVSNLDCKVLLRDGATVALTADFDHAARAIRFRSKDRRLPLGDAAIPLRIYADYSSFEGGVATGKQWLNFETSPLSRSTTVTRIEFRLESRPPNEWQGELNSLYGLAICYAKHLDTK
ncbi:MULTISPECIES: hypothetical protein [unclassified Sphingomonas]|jgi:hypothetical protein|uniref:hypothetical protein n=2 Tax=Alphaproteobacteria TaxID=28211 RepID=UPI000967884D|nr:MULTISPECIES: hypothetical protein [unclassified Sphingomonas]MBN8810721.1 hypothetical protein [Sphingomonas sp.]OJY49371.1 MAG: hypothetical protein BGP17_12265 [Sphingomonas sp. 67-41]